MRKKQQGGWQATLKQRQLVSYLHWDRRAVRHLRNEWLFGVWGNQCMCADLVGKGPCQQPFKVSLVIPYFQALGGLLLHQLYKKPQSLILVIHSYTKLVQAAWLVGVKGCIWHSTWPFHSAFPFGSKNHCHIFRELSVLSTLPPLHLLQLLRVGPPTQFSIWIPPAALTLLFIWSSGALSTLCLWRQTL